MKFSKILLAVFLFLFIDMGTRTLAQQPQTQTAPTFSVNAKYVNGVAPGYAPTIGSGLTLNLGGGTANCQGVIVTYTAGTLAMTASTTNYVYLNTGASCAPAVGTTVFSTSVIPLAIVTTNGSAITGISDVRTPFAVTSLANLGGAALSGAAFTGPIGLGPVATATSVFPLYASNVIGFNASYWTGTAAATAELVCDFGLGGVIPYTGYYKCAPSASPNNPPGGWSYDFSNATLPILMPSSYSVGGNVITQPSSAGTLALTSNLANIFAPIQIATNFSGATADIKINACLAAIPSGGTCDARGFGFIGYSATPTANQTIASTVTIGARQTLLLDPSTTFEPSAAGINMFNVLANGWIDGLFANTSNVVYTGSVVTFNTTTGEGANTGLSHFQLRRDSAYPPTAGNGITFSADNPTGVQGIAFVHITHGEIFGFYNGLDFDDSVGTGTPGAQYINGNNIDDVQILGSPYCITMNTGAQSVTGDTIGGNLFTNVQCESGDLADEIYTLNLTGTGTNSINANRWVNFQSWDGGALNIQVGATWNNVGGNGFGDTLPSTAGIGNWLNDTEYTPSHTTPNLLVDSGFYNGFASWTNPGTTWSIVPGAGRGGTAAMQFGVANSGIFNTIFQNIMVPPGYYVATAWIDTSELAANAGDVVFEATAYPSGSTLAYLPISPAVTRNSPYELDITLPSGQTGITLTFQSGSVVVTGSNVVSFSDPMIQAGRTPTNYVESSPGIPPIVSATSFTASGGMYSSTATISVTSISNATVLPSSGASSGILVLRDNTSGGSALFLIDPNAGSQLIGTSQIAGLSTAGGITWSAGNWHVTLSSGSVPRTISWVIM